MSGLSNYKINKAGGQLCGKAPCILLTWTGKLSIQLYLAHVVGKGN